MKNVYLLFAGRHILHTDFQAEYFWEILNSPIAKQKLLGEHKFPKDAKITHVIFAITSENKSNSRFNPLTGTLRTVGVDRFFEPYREARGIKQIIIGIPHFNPTDKYVDIILKNIKEAENLELTPKNTIALCSTKSLIELYRKKGFSVLTGEYDMEKDAYVKPIPADAIQQLVTAKNWLKDKKLSELVSQATADFWKDMPNVPEMIKRIWEEKLLTDSGSLTEHRNYPTYAYGMNQGFLLDIKYNDIKDAVVPGRIADEGCSDGGLLVKLSHDFPDSDLIGVEITPEFLDRARARQNAGEFRQSFVFFYQRNLLNRIFEDNSIDTTICNSTTHEIWSYGDGWSSLDTYLSNKYAQTRPGGRLIIRDVVGPENKEREVYLKLNDKDGSNDISQPLPESDEELGVYLEGLSTKARFYRFAEFYLADMRQSGRRFAETKIRFREEEVDGQSYIVLSLKDAAEFISKKDYTGNFRSELNEEFAFFSFKEWKELVKSKGFSIIENPNEPLETSRVYTSEWIVENRYKGKVEIFEMMDKKLVPVEYPPTNMVLVAEKPTLK